MIAAGDEKTGSSPGPAGIGDEVVYAPHGVGRVVARQATLVAGTERDCLVVDLASGLRVTLPVEEAADRLRPVSDAAVLAKLLSTLHHPAPARDESWTRRIKESKAKLASGRVTELAELVRDGMHSDTPGVGPRLSPGERVVYLQARQLLVREVCSARGVEEAEAETWIDSQFTDADESED